MKRCCGFTNDCATCNEYFPSEAERSRINEALEDVRCGRVTEIAGDVIKSLKSRRRQKRRTTAALRKGRVRPNSKATA